MTDRQLARAAYVPLGVGLAVGWGLPLSQLAWGAVDLNAAGAMLGYALLSGLPYALAGGATRWLQPSRRALGALAASWTVLVLASIGLLVDAVLWRPSHLSSLVYLVLPPLQVPAVCLATLAAWAIRRRAA